VVLMSATVCVDLYASYFGVDPRTSSLHVGARRFPVAEYYADDIVDSLRLPENLHSKAQRLVLHTGERPPHASAQHPLVKAIVRSVGTPGSSILVFVPGLADILDLTDKIEQLPGFVCTPIHSDVPFDEQLSVFQKTESVRVILATNAAESGVTIPDCDHVIDLGTAKEWTSVWRSTVS
jgi:HrpA-like RNA helicase